MKEGFCQVCNRIKLVRKTRSGLVSCHTCITNKRYHETAFHEACFECSRVRHVSTRINEKPYCYVCYRRLFIKPKVCQLCGAYTHLSKYQFTGLEICNTCRSRLRKSDASSFETCVSCGKDRVVCTRDANGLSICVSCHQRNKRSK
jgi:hypothetical protein